MLEYEQDMVKEETKKAAKPDLDTGSSAAQVVVATERIAQLTEHLKVNKKDFSARRGLLQLVGQRRRLLRYLARTDSKQYLDLTAKLGIRK